MKKYLIAIALLFISIVIIAQDAPSGYTNYFGLRMWDEGNYPGADSVNQNLIDIDNIMHVRDQRIDSAKNAISWMFNYPSGTFKRFDSTEFDNDTLKVKSGVFPKLSAMNTFTDVNNFSNLRTDFGNGTSGILNFTVANDAGGIFFKKNNSTDVLKWDETDGPYWQVLSGMTVAGDLDITGTYKVNGTPISSGGGDAYLNNRQTFTKRNVFTDTLKVNGITLLDSAKVTGTLNAGYLRGSGEDITDLSADNITVGNLTDAVLSANIVKYSSFDTAYVSFLNQQNTFTKYNLFSDSIRVNGVSRIDTAIVSGGFSINTLFGQVFNDDFVIKGLPNTFTDENTFQSVTSFNDVTNFQARTTFGKSVLFSDSIRSTKMARFDSAIVSGNISVGTINGIAPSNFPTLSGTNTFTSENNFSGEVNLTNPVNIISGDGSGLTALDASNIGSGTLNSALLSNEVPKDSSLFARVGSGISETVNGIWTFVYGLFATGNITTSGNIICDTLKGVGNQITNLRRSIMYLAANVVSPADATTYYFGGLQASAPSTSADARRVYFPVNCTIKAVTISSYHNTTSTSETLSYYIRVNNTTDYTISTTAVITTGSDYNAFSNTGLTVPINSGDYIEIKVVCPTWATNPTNVSWTATLSIE